MDMSLSKLRELVMDREAEHAAVHLATKCQIWLSDWTELMMKRTSFFGVSSRRSCKSSENHPTLASSALVIRAQTWITLILNGFPSKWTETIFHFWFLHPSTVFWTLLLNSTLVWSIKVIYSHQNSDVHGAFRAEPIQTFPRQWII